MSNDSRMVRTADLSPPRDSTTWLQPVKHGWYMFAVRPSVCLSACQAVSWVPSVAFLCHFALFTTLRQIKQSSPHSLANLPFLFISCYVFSPSCSQFYIGERWRTNSNGYKIVKLHVPVVKKETIRTSSCMETHTSTINSSIPIQEIRAFYVSNICL